MDKVIVLRPTNIVMRPKSAIRGVPWLSTRMFAYQASQRDTKISYGRSTDPFEIPMNDPELVKICCAGHDSRKLTDMRHRKSGIGKETADRITNCKRFTSGLDLVYSIRFPFRIQSETMRKLRGSVETETPNNIKMLECDRRFQPMTSRQNRYAQSE